MLSHPAFRRFPCSPLLMFSRFLADSGRSWWAAKSFVSHSLSFLVAIVTMLFSTNNKSKISGMATISLLLSSVFTWPRLILFRPAHAFTVCNIRTGYFIFASCKNFDFFKNLWTNFKNLSKIFQKKKKKKKVVHSRGRKMWCNIFSEKFWG